MRILISFFAFMFLFSAAAIEPVEEVAEPNAPVEFELKVGVKPQMPVVIGTNFTYVDQQTQEEHTVFAPWIQAQYYFLNNSSLDITISHITFMAKPKQGSVFTFVKSLDMKSKNLPLTVGAGTLGLLDTIYLGFLPRSTHGHHMKMMVYGWYGSMEHSAEAFSKTFEFETTN